MKTTKPYTISKRAVLEAYKRVRTNKGAAGIDKKTIADFEGNLKDNLYKIWNRMSSGSYFPPAVRRVEIPKGDGKIRNLGIPTVSDRIAQMVVKMYLEPKVESIFHEDSYGYRPGKSAIKAVGVARQRCWKYDWVLDVDIKGFFDNIDHELMMRAVKRNTDCKWILLYVERWLKAPVQHIDGILEQRKRGTPQGGVISPLLANLFLHYAFDEWMKKKYPDIPFERYADDIVVHCKTESESQKVREALEKRLAECKLELHPEKTKIIYCKDGNRQKEYPDTKFEFLGYTYRARLARARRGHYFVNFSPGASNNARKQLMEKMKGLRIHRRSGTSLNELATIMNPILRGWINYFNKYHRTTIFPTLSRIDEILIKWARKKYKRFNHSYRMANKWLGSIAEKEPNLFAHWQIGIKPAVGR